MSMSFIADKKVTFVPVVEQFTKEHLEKAYHSVRAAFKDDPLHKYLMADAKVTPTTERWRKRIWKLRVGRDIQKKLAFTINEGDAVIYATPPAKDSKKPSPPEKLYERLILLTKAAFLLLLKKESLKRSIEMNDKATAMLKDKLGSDGIDEYYYIDLIATDPNSQGQGYGSALMNTILFSADLKGRPASLFSSSPANVPFYASFGFEVIGNLELGKDNPKWNKDPVIVPLMIRKMRDSDETHDIYEREDQLN